ncbi:TonB-dependent receptor domain-containing protein [Roseateles sp. LYH14W]|uniref:TonB-dependent receptor domain-containing protein n=1 Tax=Pelomonas parva TaxID=3299032 RepID=A0ABW7F4B7_9BURK
MKPTRIACAAALLCLSGAVVAQTPAADQPAAQKKMERITITGSSIKRLVDEKSMPIEVITALDMRQQGWTSVDQVVDNLTANGASINQVTNNAVFGGDGEKTFGGANFANLRGLGPSGTLVLLNGRRVATHGMSGGSVDLNAIPMDAIERIEVLKDGASAIYGTDAIGGVMNFITKTSYQGLALSGNYITPEASGGGQTARLSAALGFGDLDRDGFNLMATVTVDNNRILRGTDRPWATGYQPDRFLTPDTSSSVHANIIGATNTALTTAGTVVGTGDPTRYTFLNLLAIQGQCEAIPNQIPLAPNIQVWNLFGHTQASSRYRCARDYGRNYMLKAPQDSINGMLKGTFRINADHQAAVEIMTSSVTNRGEYSPLQVSTGNTTATLNGVTTRSNTHLPVSSQHYLDMRALVGATQFDPALPIAYRVNFLNDLGFRIRENETDNLRVQTTMEGTVWGLDYSLGAGYGESKSKATLVNGFANTRKLVDLLASGEYNPFIMPGESQSDAVVQAFEDMQMRGKIYDGKTSVKQVDATISGPIGNFLAGPLEFALGASAREESYEFSGSRNFICIDSITALTLQNNNNDALTFGCPGNSSSPTLSRKISAVFGELITRPLKGLELTLQVRHDKYQVIGGTTNPKVGIKYQPIDTLLFRGSASTGFRAPTSQQINQGVVVSQLTGQFRDPVLCADVNNPTDATQCARLSLPFAAGGNPNLMPEKSRQSSVGIVFAPTANFQAYADYWQVKLEDRIRALSTAEMIANYDIFKDSFVRDPSTNIVQYIQAGWVNSAGSRTKGIDFGVKQVFDALQGRFTASLTGTKMISNKEQTRANAPFIEYVGKWNNTSLYVPWRINASLGYRTGPWNVTLSGIYRDGYEDQNRGPTAVGGANYTNIEPYVRNIEAYKTFNLVTSYTGIKGLTITGSLINLADAQPPFTWHNVDSAAGTGWDPRVASPMGRTWGVSFRWAME